MTEPDAVTPPRDRDDGNDYRDHVLMGRLDGRVDALERRIDRLEPHLTVIEDKVNQVLRAMAEVSAQKRMASALASFLQWVAVGAWTVIAWAVGHWHMIAPPPQP